jgi:hypothetical protein
VTAPTHGGKRPGAGRPRTAGPRVQLAIRCDSEEQRDRWHEAAGRAGVELAAKVRELLDRWARRELRRSSRAPCG